MSMNSRYRERKYNTSDNERLLRALSQPVQAWDKKWTQHSNSKTLQTFKWVKSDRTIEFEQDEESEEEPEPMETEQTPAVVQVETSTITTEENNEPVTTTITETTSTESKVESGTKEPVSTTTTTTTEAVTTTAAGVNESVRTTTTTISNKSSESTIPGGPSTLLTNKALSSVQQEDMDEDDQRSQTPKLDDISDEEPEPADNDDDDNDVDSMNDPSKHPALAPHAQAHMTDDETMTDSTAATPQTEGNTPMPLLEDDDMEETPQQQVAHPLSQEILTGIMENDMASLNNDSPAIQTPEDNISVTHPHHPIHHEEQDQQ